jgi:prephenate dehydrogenase
VGPASFLSMSIDFKKVAVLGGGLLGGSLALALRERFPELAVTLWSRREETAAEARQRGITGASSVLADCVAGADLIVLSTPVGVMKSLIEESVNVGLVPGALVTDVGSVKSRPHRDLDAFCKSAGLYFIGSHPMAGSEQKGIQAASAGLFQGAACMLTDDGRVGEPLTGRLERFWQAVGCRTNWIGAAEHDSLVARISHFPHAMAAAAALVALEHPEDARFAGGGLRDTTRVAGGDPWMWAEIFAENRQALATAVEASIHELSEMLAMLRQGDQEAVRQWLTRAKDARDQARRDF